MTSGHAAYGETEEELRNVAALLRRRIHGYSEKAAVLEDELREVEAKLRRLISPPPQAAPKPKHWSEVP